MTHRPKTISDESLRARIIHTLTAEGSPTISELHIGVVNGVVHLAGLVDTAEIRISIEEIASRVKGVRGVVNRIEAPGAPSPARTIHIDLNDKSEAESNQR